MLDNLSALVLMLDCLSFQDSQERNVLEMKARVMSRKVWELLMLLPTNLEMLEAFKNLVTDEVIFAVLYYQPCIHMFWQFS